MAANNDASLTTTEAVSVIVGAEPSVNRMPPVMSVKWLFRTEPAPSARSVWTSAAVSVTAIDRIAPVKLWASIVATSATVAPVTPSV